MVDPDTSQIIDKTSLRLHDTVRREYKSLSNIEDVRNIEYAEKRKWEKLERLRQYIVVESLFFVPPPIFMLPYAGNSHRSEDSAAESIAEFSPGHSPS